MARNYRGALKGIEVGGRELGASSPPSLVDPPLVIKLEFRLIKLEIKTYILM